MKLKICGITNQNDMNFCAKYADALGFIIEFPKSPRSISIEKAKKLIKTAPPFISTIPVIPDFKKALMIYSKLKPDIIQLHGKETVEDLKEFRQRVNCRIIKACAYEKALEFSKYSDAILLDDKYSEHDFSKINKIIKKIEKPIIIAGHLNTKNILNILEKIEPYGVDVASGVEIKPGIKDPEKIKQFKKLIDLGQTVGPIIQNKKNLHTHEFYNSLRTKNKIHFITEIKPASPSKGKLRDVSRDLDDIVKSMEIGGVSAISVLVEKQKFNGSINLLKAVRRQTNLPILAKGFFFDKSQINEIKSAGANAFLLMIRVVESQGKNVNELISFGSNIGLDSIVEVSNLEELNIALKANAKIIQINNRNIYNDLSINFTNISLGKNLPEDIILISASGIDKSSDIQKIYKISNSRINAVLIGSSIMESEDIKNKIQDLKEAEKEVFT